MSDAEQDFVQMNESRTFFKQFAMSRKEHF